MDKFQDYEYSFVTIFKAWGWHWETVGVFNTDGKSLHQWHNISFRFVRLCSFEGYTFLKMLLLQEPKFGMLMAPLEFPLTKVEDDLRREALELFNMVDWPSTQP